MVKDIARWDSFRVPHSGTFTHATIIQISKERGLPRKLKVVRCHTKKNPIFWKECERVRLPRAYVHGAVVTRLRPL